jgi:hypothetical protein
MVPKLRSALLGLVALAWMTHAYAVPEDRDARASRWATTDLACAASSAPVPGCGGQGTQGRTASGEELTSGYVARAVAAAAAARFASAARAAPGNGSSQKRSTTPPRAPTKADDYLPIVHALRETIGALGSNADDEILLAFIARPAAAQTDGERPRPVRETSAAFPFVALSPFSASLSGIYQGDGARFDHVLFHAIDPARLLAWNVFTPESAPEPAPERAARLPGGLIPGGPMPSELGPNTALWGLPEAWPERKSGEPNDKAAKKKRVIVYMQKGRTVVMTLEDPAPNPAPK